MNSACRLITLGEFIELKRGYDLPQSQRRRGSVPIVSSSGVSDHHDEVKVRGPGVVTGRYGTIGNVYYIDEDYWPLNTTLYVRDFKGNDPRFVSYFLKTLDFLAFSDKAAVPGVNRNHLHQAQVRVPPLPEQQRIAHILGTLDDKIELNRQMNRTLEEIARTLFKAWFVDFAPVRAKAEGRDTGLPAEIAALFPSALVDSELGEIPEGWRVGNVSDIGTVVCGKTPSTSDQSNYGDEIPFIRIPDMHGRVFVYETEKALSHKGANSQSSKYLPKEAICVSCIGTLGLVSITSTRSQTNQQINSVIPFVGRGVYWAFHALRGLASAILAGASGGSVLHNLNTGDFSRLKLLHPAVPIEDKYDCIVRPVFERIQANDIETATLAELRDTLLPRLLSGELRVSAAEEMVGSVV